MPRLIMPLVVALVLLRLAIGWHFFNEGYEKLKPGFSSAGFLRAAKGPLAGPMQSFVTGPHGAYQHLREKEPEGPVGASWLAEFRADWEQGLARVGRLGIAADKLDAARQAAERGAAEFDKYLKGETVGITDLRHEVERLAALRDEAQGDPPPYLAKRVADKEKEIWAAMQPWAAAAEALDASVADKVVAALGVTADSAPSAARVKATLVERSGLWRVDRIVTAVVLGSGVCLFLGIFTPVAAVVAAGFLLSVMATQPPWVAGADTTYFFYQLVEVVALVTLAVAGGGRWVGFDRLLFGPGEPVVTAAVES